MSITVGLHSLDDEFVRFLSFQKFPSAFDKKALAASGFYYTGQGDSVRCFKCGIILHSWDESDNIDLEHYKHSPSCSLIRKRLLDYYSEKHHGLYLLDVLQDIKSVIKDIRQTLYINLPEDTVDKKPFSSVGSQSGTANLSASNHSSPLNLSTTRISNCVLSPNHDVDDDINRMFPMACAHK